MAGEWQEVRLGDVVVINPNAIGSDWPFPHIKYVDISSVGEGMLIEPPRLMSFADAPSRAKRLVRQGDTVLSTVRPNRRSMFFVPKSEPDLVVSTGFAVLRPRLGMIDPRYLYACVFDKAFTDYLVSREKGAAYPAVLPDDVADATINLPPLPEQRAIAHILGTLDDKIELLRRMSETLEAMARALFKSWFIDFDPVRAKAAVRRKHPDWTNDQVSRAACPNLKPEIAALFPDSFEDSELGQIPKGWEVTTLGDFVEFVKGRSYRSDELSSSDTALVTLKSFVRGGGYRIDGLKPFTGAYIPKQVVEPGEVVLACTDVTQAGEVIGRTAIVRGSRTYSCLVASLDVLIIRPRPPLTRSFVYELGHSADFVDHTYAHTIGTTVLHLSTDAVAAFPFAMPPSALIDRYDQIAVPIIQRSEAIGGNSEMLAAIRDALLPKLISNELRIPDAESFIALAQAAAMEATS